MQTNILWTGREYYSLENCLVKINDSGSEINSVIIGQYEEKIYRVEYRIKTNSAWETVFVELHARHSNRQQDYIFEGDGKGNWMANGEHAIALNGCIDVDIPLTPFTNTLPINRLRLSSNEERQIKVIYFDVLDDQITPVTQKYVCLSKTRFHYENVPNDFEAIIEVDNLGLVVDYPSLFVRTAALAASY